MPKGWCLRCIHKNNYKYISTEPIYTDINKFIEHIKFKIGLNLKVYGKQFNKIFNFYKNIDDYNEKYINEIIESEYVYYDNDMNIICWIEVHNIIS